MQCFSSYSLCMKHKVALPTGGNSPDDSSFTGSSGTFTDGRSAPVEQKVA